jgi:hypothetical protein
MKSDRKKRPAKPNSSETGASFLFVLDGWPPSEEAFFTYATALATKSRKALVPFPISRQLLSILDGRPARHLFIDR